MGGAGILAEGAGCRDRRQLGHPGAVHHATRGLGDQLGGLPACRRSAQAPRRDRHDHGVQVPGRQLGGGADRPGCAGGGRHEHELRTGEHAVDRRRRAGCRWIEHEQLLARVAVQVAEVITIRGRGLEPDHLGAEVGEEASGERAVGAGQIDDVEIREEHPGIMPQDARLVG